MKHSGMLSSAELHQVWQQRRHLPEVHERLLDVGRAVVGGT